MIQTWRAEQTWERLFNVYLFIFFLSSFLLIFPTSNIPFCLFTLIILLPVPRSVSGFSVTVGNGTVQYVGFLGVESQDKKQILACIESLTDPATDR